jgi:hypothetical protein
MTSSDRTEQLTEAVGRLADVGINVIIAEINYGYEYDSHPQLRAANPSRKDQSNVLVLQRIKSFLNIFTPPCVLTVNALKKPHLQTQGGFFITTPQNG